MELVYDKQLLYCSIIGLLNLQYVRSSSNLTFDGFVASVQWSIIITKLRLCCIHLPDLNALNFVAGFSWCRWSSRHWQGHASCTGIYMHLNANTPHCTPLQLSLSPFFNLSLSLFSLCPFSVHVHYIHTHAYHHNYSHWIGIVPRWRSKMGNRWIQVMIFMWSWSGEYREMNQSFYRTFRM